jgi:membrane protease subunit HflK
MGWDDGDKGNPWRPNGGKGQTDLDAIVKDFQRRLTRLFGGRGAGGRPGGGPALSSGLVIGALALLVIVWFLSGFYKVDAAEQGIVLRFGDYRATTQPGLQWHWPWPIEKVEKVNTGATEAWQYEGSMLTRDENIVNVELIVQFRRADPVKYLFNLREPEKTLRDVTTSAIREVVGKNDLDFILTQGRAQVAAQTQQLIQTTLDSYETGIKVYEVNLQEANFPREVEGAVQEAVKAREDRERMILEADKYRNGVVPRARGDAAQRKQEAEAYRDRVVAEAEGESDRFEQILAEYTKAPEITRRRMYLETLESILANSTKVLVNTGEDNNLLYLPLDKLLEQSRGSTASAPAPTASTPVETVTAPRTSRERTAR